jgi:hypothetical protein
MSEFREFRPNLAIRHITENGGVLVSEALAEANTIMKEMRKPILRAIDRFLKDIDKRYGPSPSRNDDLDFHTLYELSAHIIDISGPVADMQIDRAAFSLCDLVDRCEGMGKWDWPSVDVHLDALHLLRDQGDKMKAAQRKIILDGLDRVTERLPLPEVES